MIRESFRWVSERFENQLIPEIVFVYCAYLISSLPIFYFLSIFFGNKSLGFLRRGRAGREPGLARMRFERLRARPSCAFVGMNLKTGRPVHLTDDQRLMHTDVVGSTGTGKTDSVLLPILAHDIANGKGAVVIDGKGDLELLQRILYIVNVKKRRPDFYFFSLSHPERSNTYNPLLRGNATELKDKLIGSMPWGEEFYRRMAEQAALTILNALVACGKKVRFRDLYGYLTELDALKRLVDETPDPPLKSDLHSMVTQFRNNAKFLSGLIADLYLMSHSEFSKLVDVVEPEIDLLDFYKNKKIVYFQLNLQGYGDTAKRIGRMVLQDLKAVSSHIQSEIPEVNRKFFSIFIDDASSFLDVNFIDFLNKARASKLAITLLHQSVGDLVIKRDLSFAQQVMENTNVKIILRQDDPQSVEKLAKMGGTRKTMISTYQTEEKISGKGLTGQGSIREGQMFRIEPDLIRSLRRGEAFIIWKSPTFQTHHLKLDFLACPAYQEEPASREFLTSVSQKEDEKNTADTAAKNALSSTQQAGAEDSETEVPADITDPLELVKKLFDSPQDSSISSTFQEEAPGSRPVLTLNTQNKEVKHNQN